MAYKKYFGTLKCCKKSGPNHIKIIWANLPMSFVPINIWKASGWTLKLPFGFQHSGKTPNSALMDARLCTHSCACRRVHLSSHFTGLIRDRYFRYLRLYKQMSVINFESYLFIKDWTKENTENSQGICWGGKR